MNGQAGDGWHTASGGPGSIGPPRPPLSICSSHKLLNRRRCRERRRWLMEAAWWFTARGWALSPGLFSIEGTPHLPTSTAASAINFTRCEQQPEFWNSRDFSPWRPTLQSVNKAAWDHWRPWSQAGIIYQSCQINDPQDGSSIGHFLAAPVARCGIRFLKDTHRVFLVSTCKKASGKECKCPWCRMASSLHTSKAKHKLLILVILSNWRHVFNVPFNASWPL